MENKNTKNKLSIEEMIEKKELEIKQKQNEKKKLQSRLKERQRKEKTKRLIEKGSIFEKIFEGSSELNSDEYMKILDQIQNKEELELKILEMIENKEKNKEENNVLENEKTEII